MTAGSFRSGRSRAQKRSAGQGGAYQRTAGGAQVLAVSIPCRYLHAPQCVIAEADMQAVRSLLLAFLREFDKKDGNL